MADQVKSLQDRGISSCAAVNSLLSMPERADVLERVRLGDIAILLIAPEQLRSRAVRGALESREIGSWVMDEAHCLSKWGHAFRPDYRYVGRFIRDHSSPEDRIAVLGSEPEIYFYARRRSATGYIYTYALMEPQPFAATMQDEMIREIEAAHPRYLVFAWIKDSWLAQPGSNQVIVQWARRYVRECYDAVGVADIVSEEETRMMWDADLRGYVAASENLVYTFKRKDDAACSVGR